MHSNEGEKMQAMREQETEIESEEEKTTTPRMHNNGKKVFCLLANILNAKLKEKHHRRYATNDTQCSETAYEKTANLTHDDDAKG